MENGQLHRLMVVAWLHTHGDDRRIYIQNYKHDKFFKFKARPLPASPRDFRHRRVRAFHLLRKKKVRDSPVR